MVGLYGKLLGGDCLGEGEADPHSLFLFCRYQNTEIIGILVLGDDHTTTY